MPSDKKRVLVLCTGNSCRSQMAEGWINHLLGGQWEARSAGTAPAARVHPLAVRVMAEAGVDIAGGKPEHVERLPRRAMGPDRHRLRLGAGRPAPRSHGRWRSSTSPSSTLRPPRAVTSERMGVFRRVRDEIRDRLVPEVLARG